MALFVAGGDGLLGLFAVAGDEGFQTPDLSTIVQEIVDRAGWASGNAMVIFVDTTNTNGKRLATAYEASSSLAPRIHIEWSIAP